MSDKKIKKNKLLVGFDDYMGNRVKNNPEFRYHYLMACMEDANDPELSEEEQLTALILAIRAIVESYGSVDKFIRETKVDVSRKTLYNFIDGKPPKRGPSAITLLRVFNAVGLSITPTKVS